VIVFDAFMLSKITNDLRSKKSGIPFLKTKKGKTVTSSLPLVCKLKFFTIRSDVLALYKDKNHKLRWDFVYWF